MNSSPSMQLFLHGQKSWSTGTMKHSPSSQIILHEKKIGVQGLKFALPQYNYSPQTENGNTGTEDRSPSI